MIIKDNMKKEGILSTIGIFVVIAFGIYLTTLDGSIIGALIFFLLVAKAVFVCVFQFMYRIEITEEFIKIKHFNSKVISVNSIIDYDEKKSENKGLSTFVLRTDSCITKVYTRYYDEFSKILMNRVNQSKIKAKGDIKSLSDIFVALAMLFLFVCVAVKLSEMAGYEINPIWFLLCIAIEIFLLFGVLYTKTYKIYCNNELLWKKTLFSKKIINLQSVKKCEIKQFSKKIDRIRIFYGDKIINIYLSENEEIKRILM